MKKSIIYKVLLIGDLTVLLSLIACAIAEIILFPKENPELLAFIACFTACLTIGSSILIMYLCKRINSSAKKSN